MCQLFAKVKASWIGARWLCRLTLIAFTLFSSSCAFADDRTSEYQLKAALIYKLTKFVTWPPSGPHFEICVYGSNPFGDAIKHLDTKLVGDLPIRVRLLSRINTELEGCRILFVTGSASSQLSEILLAISYSSTLTISDIQNFANFGGMIELSRRDHRIGFRINLEEAKKAKLQIASPLLELATIVRVN